MHVCEADSKRETVITWIDADVSPYLQYDIAKWLLNAIQADQILFLDSLLFPHRFGLDTTPASLYHIKSESFPCSLSIPVLPSPIYCKGFGAELMTCVAVFSSCEFLGANPIHSLLSGVLSSRGSLFRRARADNGSFCCLLHFCRYKRRRSASCSPFHPAKKGIRQCVFYCVHVLCFQQSPLL